MAHSFSTSSTGESPSPSPSPVIRRRKRTARVHPHQSDSTKEDEDTADCLMLLARGEKGGSFTPKKDFFSYECKTCNKSFSSFQALGGHRASHKKPKTASLDAETCDSIAKPAACSLIVGGKQRIHECARCGSEFPSGQALGGHMRRHRQNNLEGERKEKRVLLLDLNLPAPVDDEPFVFSSPVAAAAALVGCHY